MKRTFHAVAIASCPNPRVGSSLRLNYLGISWTVRSRSEIGNDGVEQRKACGRDAQSSGAVDLHEIQRA